MLIAGLCIAKVERLESLEDVSRSGVSQRLNGLKTLNTYRGCIARVEGLEGLEGVSRSGVSQRLEVLEALKVRRGAEYCKS